MCRPYHNFPLACSHCWDFRGCTIELRQSGGRPFQGVHMKFLWQATYTSVQDQGLTYSATQYSSNTMCRVPECRLKSLTCKTSSQGRLQFLNLLYVTAVNVVVPNRSSWKHSKECVLCSRICSVLSEVVKCTGAAVCPRVCRVEYTVLCIPRTQRRGGLHLPLRSSHAWPLPPSLAFRV